jgi:hypothetical protein
MLNRTLALGLGLFFAVGLTSLCAQPSRSVKNAKKAGPAYERHGPRFPEKTFDSVSTDRHERTVRDTVDFTPGTVAVENEKGSITVATWDRDVVAYEARIVSEQSAEYAEQTAIEAEHFHQRLSVMANFEALEPQWSFGPEVYGYGVSHPAVHYTLTVPRTAALSVEDHASAIEVVGLNGDVRVDTHEGSLRVADQRGDAQIQTHEGTVSVTNVRGDLKADTHEGRITVKGMKGRLLLDTHDGRAEVGIDSLAAVEVETHEGTVTLTLPRDAGFDLATELDEEADVQGDFALDSLRNEEGNYHGAVQGGGPLMHLRSHEGTITLRAR